MQRIMRELSIVPLFTAASVLLSQPVLADVTVFSDTFESGSTLNQTQITPTANSTTYEIASTKTTSSSISPGHLSMGITPTTSGFIEAQALFATTPVILSSIGDYIDFSMTFTNTAQIYGGSSSSHFYIGLYNSGGAAPLAGVLTNAGLSTTASSPYATGGAQLWQGYSGRVVYNSNSKISTRPMQNGTGTTSANQDLVADNVGGGAYNNPAGVNLGTSSSTLTITAGAPYTVQFRLTLTAANTLDVTNLVYDALGNVVFKQGKTATGANYLTNSFDGLAFGYRYSGTSTNTAIDVNSIIVTTNVIPEPSTFALAGLGMGLALSVIRRRRR